MSFLVTRSVFFRSIATVIGPTPPGTGVIKPAFFFTSKRKEKKALTKNVSKPLFPFHCPHMHKGLWQGRYCREGTSQGRSVPAAIAGMEHGQDQGCEVLLLIWMYYPGLVLGQGFTTYSSWTTCSTLPSPHSSTGTHTAWARTYGRLIPMNSLGKGQFLPTWPGWPTVPGTSGWQEIRMRPGEQYGCASPPSASWDTAPAISGELRKLGMPFCR